MKDSTVTKLNLAMLIAVIGVLLPTSAQSMSCGDAPRVMQHEHAQLNHRIGLIAQHRASVEQNQTTIARGQPLLEALNHTLKVHEASLSTIGKCQDAIDQAILIVRDSVTASAALKKVMDKLKTKLTADPHLSLSKLLREESNRSGLTKEQIRRLVQIAGAVALLESSTKDWADIEKEIVRNFLDGRQALLDGLFAKLQSLQQQIAMEKSQQQAIQGTDSAKAESLKASIAAASSQIQSANVAISQLEAENAASWATYAQADRRNKECNYSTRDTTCGGMCI